MATITADARAMARSSRSPFRPPAPSSLSQSLALMIAVGFMLRFAVVLLVFRGVASPVSGYSEFGWEMGWVARSIAAGRGFSSPFIPLTGATALVPPIYPYLLATVFRLFGVYSASSALVMLTINSILSALTCIPVFHVARHIAGRRSALFAGWLWAIYPFSIYFAATRVWDYALTAALFSCTWWVATILHRKATARNSFGFGVLYGVTILSNPSLLPVYPLVAGMALWKLRESRTGILGTGIPKLGILKPAGMMLLGTLITLSPWTVRNYRALGVAVPVRDGFWLECWAGNHGDLSTSNPASSHPASNEAEMASFIQLGEVKYLAGKRTLALDYVASHPLQTVAATARRVARFWTGFWTLQPAYLRAEPTELPNIFFCTALTLLMLYGLKQQWQRSPRSALPAALLLLIFPLPYYLTHSSMDYRQPIEPMILVFVAVACSRMRVPARQPFRSGEVLWQTERPRLSPSDAAAESELA